MEYGKRPLEYGTRLLHTGREVDPITGAATVPIYQVSMFDQPGLSTPGAFDYARSGNPTRQVLESIMANLEGGVAAFAFSSGMAAVTSALMLFSAGDHLVVTDDCYGHRATGAALLLLVRPVRRRRPRP